MTDYTKKPDVGALHAYDNAEGVFVNFNLADGLEQTDTLTLWTRARINGNDYYMPTGLEVLPGGKSATLSIPAQCVSVSDNGEAMINLEFYYETYPEDYNEDTFDQRVKGEALLIAVSYDPDWFGMSKPDHDTRVEFETRGMDHQISEARLYDRLTAQQEYAHDQRFLSTETGLWMTNVGHDIDKIAGISLEQPDMGQAWLRRWIDAILAALDIPEEK